VSAPSESLPHVDEHAVAIDAGGEEAWKGLLRIVEGSFGGGAAGRFARLLGCADMAASGPRPLERGSTVPGFHVELAEPRRELALAGSHRFSRYALIFHLEERGAGAVLRAETRAEFPGPHGRAYRALVIGTRVHVLVTRRLLDAVKQRSERSAG
jgi:hypothetical protein